MVLGLVFLWQLALFVLCTVMLSLLALCCSRAVQPCLRLPAAVMGLLIAADCCRGHDPSRHLTRTSAHPPTPSLSSCPACRIDDGASPPLPPPQQRRPRPLAPVGHAMLHSMPMGDWGVGRLSCHGELPRRADDGRRWRSLTRLLSPEQQVTTQHDEHTPTLHSRRRRRRCS